VEIADVQAENGSKNFRTEILKPYVYTSLRMWLFNNDIPAYKLYPLRLRQ
jgi:hypothetical protein